jgi:hypothetical protein
MRAIRRVARLVAVAAVLATAGVALGFVAALVRPRPKSGYAAAGQQPVASDDATQSGGA